MSFILDALKKSESERQRQSGPALFEVKVAPPRNRFAVWAVGLGSLLAINLAVVGWMLWRGGAPHAASAATAGVATTPAAATVSHSAAEAVPRGSGAGAYPHPMSAAAAAGMPSPTAGTAAAVAPAGVGARPAAGAVVAAAAQPAVPVPAGSARVEDARSAGASGDAGPRSQVAEDAREGMSPDDFAPAVEPRSTAQSPGVIRETASGLPTYQDVEAQPGSSIPSLRLDLHVYSPQPDQRFVFLNMMKLHEGDSLPHGVRVERITPDGVILSYQGKQFVLQRQ